MASGSASVHRQDEVRRCLEKVRAHPHYKDDTPAEQEDQARRLTDRARVKACFEDLLNVEPLRQNIREGDACDLLWSVEVTRHREQQKMDAAQASSLPVKLFLSKLRQGSPPPRLTALLGFKYGPLHAGLIVGNISIEWDNSSLVVPLPEPNVHESDLVARVDDQSSWQKRTREVVKDMSLANRRNMGTPCKLDIIDKTCKEKATLLDALVEVIVDYNSNRRYKVFGCNCQDFVTDALNALHIRHAPSFRGNLGQYFEKLTRGKPTSAITFDSHEDLDNYVGSTIDVLDRHNKEYLLCLYFQFHAAALSRLDLTPEEQDEWACPIKACLCSELEYRVENEALFFHEFTRQQPESLPHSPTNQVSVPGLVTAATPLRAAQQPNIPPVEEVEEGDGEEGTDAEFLDHAAIIQKHLDEKDTTDAQKERLLKFSQRGYSTKVLNKLRTHPLFRDKNEDELQMAAETLSEKELFRQAYFSDYIDDMGVRIVMETSLEECERATPLSPQELKDKASDRFRKLFNIHLNLVLRLRTRADSKRPVAKAPICLALQVGEYVFEWDEGSLVVPQRACRAEEAGEPRLLSPVLQKSTWREVVDREKESVRQSIEQTNYGRQIDLHFELTKKRDQFLLPFVDTVLRYNRDLYHSPRSCNNLKFLSDAMRSLGLKSKLSSSIKDHMSQLKPSKSILRRSMSTHQELDDMVAEVLTDSLSREDTEYLIAQYYVLHVGSWEQEGVPGETTRWECTVGGCMLASLESRLEDLTSIPPT